MAGPTARRGRCSLRCVSRIGGSRRRRSAASWDRRVAARVCRGWVRIGCDTRWPPTCCAPGRRCRRSGRCCGIAATCPPRSTPRWTKTRCDRWRGRGQLRRCGHDRAARAAEDYLAMRRALGFKLTTQGRQLMSFVDYCESRGSDRITSDLALEWATTTRSGSTHDGYLARRLMSVRIFARHYQTLDPDSEIPPEDALPHHKCRITPYLYSPGEIAALIDAAAQLTPPLRAATWQTLIGLLAVTGMRKSEACRLDDDHVDLDAATLLILDSKFGKSRRLFLHDPTVSPLRDYRRRRDLWFPDLAPGSFFVSTRGTRIDVHNLTRTFAGLLDDAGIAPPGRRRPRMHDLRHGFTVATLLDLYRDGGDIQARLPVLSTWLGHVDPKSTYWYLQAIPELLALAAGRLESTAFGELS